MKSVMFSLMFVLGLGLLGTVTGQANGTPVGQEPPCYADKKYKVAEDCPHCCEVNCYKIRFDEDGHLRVRFDGTLVKEKIGKKNYFVSYDIDGDGKADVTINAHFSDCGDDHPCGKIKGTIVSKCPQEDGTAGKPKKNKCTFVGYTRHDDDHDDECCISLGDLVGHRD